MDVNVEINPAYISCLSKEQFIQILFGGSSSGKSYFMGQRIVLSNLQGVNWLCCRNVAKTMRNSIFNEITKAISNMGLSSFYSINKSDMVITCNKNKKQILFCGLDDVEKVKSITPQNGVLERIFVEEATEIKRDAFMQLKKRLRGFSSFQKYIVLAFNPILKSHWIYKEFFSKWIDGKNTYEDDELFIKKTTYKDNKFLTKSDIYQLEHEEDEYFYQVYTLGNWGILGNVIYRNWRVADLSGIKDQFDNIYNGLDFGYANDPNALVRVHLNKSAKRIYVFDELYKAGMNNDELVFECNRLLDKDYVSCDNEDPKTIDYLCDNGINAYSCTKGPNSINVGIRWLQGYEIIIDVSCQNFKNEIEQYHWKTDKQGNVMSKAVDANNHLLDALRYALCDEIFDIGTATAGKRI